MEVLTVLGFDDSKLAYEAPVPASLPGGLRWFLEAVAK